MTEQPSSIQTTATDDGSVEGEEGQESENTYEERVEQDANRRASIIETYEHHREQRLDNAKDQTETMSWSARVMHAVTPDKLRARLTSHRMTVTDVEVDADIDIDVESESPEAVFESVDNEVDNVRFELDGDAYTPWYEWAPTDPEHALNQIIDHYADGDLNRMFETTVTVNRNGPLLYPVVPTPYMSRVAHWRMSLYKAAFLLGPEVDNTFVTTTHYKVQKESKVTTNDTYSTHFSQDAALTGITIPILGVSGGILGTFVSLLIGSLFLDITGDVPWALDMFFGGSIILSVLSLLTLCFVYPVFSHKPQNSIDKATKRAVDIIVRASLKVVRSPVFLPRYLAGKLDDMSGFNSYCD